MKKHFTTNFLAIGAMLLFNSLGWGQIPNYVPTNGLVGWWPFNGNANDESGNGNNGTVNGAILTTDRNGVANSAYYFSSSGCATRIDVNVNTSSIQTGLTMSVWVMNVGNGCLGPRLLEFWGNDGPGQAQWGTAYGSLNLYGIGSITSTGFSCAAGIPMSPNNIWSHLVYTNNGSQGKFYKDGVLITTINSTGNPILASSAAFGRMNHPAYDAYNGNLDDIGIWNRALSDCEVAALYSGLLTNPPTVDLGNDTLIVCGTSTTLDATNSAAGNYLWNTGAISSTLAVTNSGEYSVTVTDTLGCSASDTVYVSILNPTITAAQSTFCLGDSTIISLSNVGGSCGTISSDLQTGLGAWYPFCSNPDDLSSLANNGTVNGAVLTDDYFSNPNAAYSFNGASNTINLTNPFLNGGQANQFTMNARVNFNSLANSPNIWGKTKFWGEVNFGVDNNGKVFLGWANSITGNKYSSIVSQNGVITTNTWYDITVVFQSGTGQIYINGQPIATSLTWTAQGGAILSTTSIENSCNFSQDANSSKFGVRIQGGSPVGYLNGVLDEFRIWDYALSPTLIQQNFEVSNFSSIWWSDGTTNQNSIQVQPTQTTTYSVTVSDGVGTCTDSIAIQVNNPQIHAGSNLSVCEGETATLTATGADTYAWDNGVVNGQPFTPTVDGYYTVTGTDTLGCSNTVSVFLDVLQPTSSIISPVSCDTYTAPDNAVYNNSGQYIAIIPNIAGCDSTITINLTVNNSNSGIDSKTACDSYTWIDGNTYTASTTSPTFTLQNANGCDSVVTLNLTINKLQGLDAGDDITACQGDNITLTGSGAATYSWTGGETNGVAFIPPVGTTTYTVTGTDDNGCSATDALSVLVEYCLDIPGGISPNGDNANDTWTITGLNQYPDAKVLVFDRWGQKVFSGDATNPTWNGTYEGKELPTADYYYIIELGNGEKFNGVVTLKR